MNYLSPLDPHVHLRGTEYPVENFAAKALIDAEAVGLSALIEMPNTTPTLTTIQALLDRRLYLNNITKSLTTTANRYIHVGLTSDLDQVRSALEFIKARLYHFDISSIELTDGLPIGDKIFYAGSTGASAIDDDTAKAIWELKAKMDYRGVSIGHFEDESAFKGEFNYLEPISHSNRQNEYSEVNQVYRQLGHALDAGFKGAFYIAHVSSPQTVHCVREFRKTKPPFKIIMEVTFHHMFLNTTDYAIHGNKVKMNPPLRAPASQELLLHYVLQGYLDIIGTDHAPHPLERKLSPTPPSGIPAIPFWPRGIQLLREYGMHEGLLRDMTFNTAERIFKLEVQPRMIETEYDPTLWEKYGWNPFSRLK